jgi:hypothetical protein
VIWDDFGILRIWYDLRPESHHEPSKRMANLELDWLFASLGNQSTARTWCHHWSTFGAIGPTIVLRGNWWSLERHCVDQPLQLFRKSVDILDTCWNSQEILSESCARRGYELPLEWLPLRSAQTWLSGTTMAAMDSWFCTRKSGSSSDI